MTTLDKQALEKVKDAARGWEGSSAEWIAEAAVKAYEAALPEARRTYINVNVKEQAFPLGCKYWLFGTYDDARRNRGDWERVVTLELREVRDA